MQMIEQEHVRELYNDSAFCSLLAEIFCSINRLNNDKRQTPLLLAGYSGVSGARYKSYI